MEKQITSQEGLSCVLLADDDNHRTLARIHPTSFLDHVHVELFKIKILGHLVLRVVYFFTILAVSSDNGKGSENYTRATEDPSNAKGRWNALVNPDNATILS